MGCERYSFDDHLFTPGIQHLLSYARPAVGERVLDLAAGSGIAARLCGRAVGSGGRVTALDVGANILKKARAFYEGPAPASWVRGDAVALPLADASFDLVVCHQGLQFFRDRPAAVGHLPRVLRPGGRVAIMTWTALADCPFYEALHDAVARHLGESAAGFVRQPFSLPEAAMLRELFEPCFGMVSITGLVIPTVHPSPAAFAEAFLRYLPPTSAPVDQVAAVAQSIADDVTRDLASWCVGVELRAPVGAHVVVAA